MNQPPRPQDPAPRAGGAAIVQRPRHESASTLTDADALARGLAEATEGPADEPLPEGVAPLLLFDGVCNLCDGWVQFVIDHERAPNVRFASLQSGVGRAALARHGLPADELSTVVLLEGGRAFTRSSAILRMCRHLRAPWSYASVLAAFPRPLRDLAYRLVAGSRYRLFGRADACRLPTPALRQRFLDL